LAASAIDRNLVAAGEEPSAAAQTSPLDPLPVAVALLVGGHGEYVIACIVAA
jgi:hypothetical protein